MKQTLDSPLATNHARGWRARFGALALSALALAPLARAAVEIRYTRSDPAIAYAGAELAKYLDRMGGATDHPIIELALFADRGLAPYPDLADASHDDAIVVEIRDGSGFIAGSNPRAVLQGAYRYLHELGCRWIRPGADGEVIPASVTRRDVSLTERASSRHRVVCIEGAVSLTNTLDVIEWMPRAGFNGFMMQFRDGYTFFDRWYTHEENPQRKRAQPIDREVAQEFTALIEKAVEQRNLTYHAVGHGWHLEAYGVPALGWMKRYDLPPEFLAKVALVGGAHPVPWDIPNLAALCWSDPEVQQRLAASVVDYAEAHRNVDYLHVWLDDTTNNKCECDRCRTKNPSDWYFQILNLVDRELTAKKLDTRIVFLAYCELLWAPLQEKLNHSPRFSFMYANSRADYSKPLDEAHRHTPLPPYTLNRLPPAASENASVAAFLNDWQQRFDGERILFEYWGGAETIPLARVAWTDLRNLPNWGLNGLINCQSLRVWFPNGLGMAVLGRTLWDRQADFDSIARDYFTAAYGENAGACYTFTDQAQAAVAKIQGLLKSSPADVHAVAVTLQADARAFAPIVARSLASTKGAQHLSWRMMDDYLKFLDLYAQFADAKTIEAGQPALLLQFRLQELLLGLEQPYQPYFQPGDFINRYAK